MNNIIIHQHLGLGDHIDCNAMIRWYAQKYDTVYLFVKNKYKSSVQKMYRDNPKIKLIPIEAKTDKQEYAEVYGHIELMPDTKFIQIGHGNYKDHPTKNCWEIFYEQINLPTETKKDLFFYKRDPDEETRVLNKLNPKNLKYAFVHDDVQRGFEIDKNILGTDLHIIKNDISENIFDFCSIIENAEEIHCMESSFKSLVELLPTKGKLYFHDFRGHPLGKTFKKWNTIKYDKVLLPRD